MKLEDLRDIPKGEIVGLFRTIYRHASIKALNASPQVALQCIREVIEEAAKSCGVAGDECNVCGDLTDEELTRDSQPICGDCLEYEPVLIAIK
jgi:hypothetical protein